MIRFHFATVQLQENVPTYFHKENNFDCHCVFVNENISIFVGITSQISIDKRTFRTFRTFNTICTHHYSPIDYWLLINMIIAIII